MKVLNKVVIGVAALALLAACGPTKTTYAKFHEQAVAAAKKEVSYKKVKFSGKTDTDGSSVTINAVCEYKDGKWSMTEGGVVEALVVGIFMGMTAELVVEDEKTTYYAGNGFKTVTKQDDGTGTFTWNSNGLLTSAKGKYSGGNADITLKYSK